MIHIEDIQHYKHYLIHGLLEDTMIQFLWDLKNLEHVNKI